MHIGDGGGRDDDTESRRLMRVEDSAHALESRVGHLEAAVVRVEAGQASQFAAISRMNETLIAFRSEAREDRKWMQGLVRDGCQGLSAVLRLLIERVTQVHVVAAIALAIAALAAGLYGVAVTYDGTGWRVGSSVEAADENRRALPDVREPDTPQDYPRGPGVPEPVL